MSEAIPVLKGPSPERDSQILIAPPQTCLRGAFDSYFGYRISTPGAERMRQYPHPRVVLIVTGADGLRVADAKSPERLLHVNSFVAGIHEHYSITESDRVSEGVQVNLEPLFARRLFRMPLSELANRVVELQDVVGAEAKTLREQMAAAPCWDRRFDLLGNALQRRVADAPTPTREIAWAWSRIRRSGGTVAISDLSDELGWSRKRLIAAFCDQVGVAPKTAARIVRFGRARELLSAGRSWPDIVDGAGYYDQSHFIREFSEFSGATPTEFAAANKPVPAGA